MFVRGCARARAHTQEATAELEARQGELEGLGEDLLRAQEQLAAGAAEAQRQHEVFAGHREEHERTIAELDYTVKVHGKPQHIGSCTGRTVQGVDNLPGREGWR
jgi:hypothetical protein